LDLDKNEIKNKQFTITAHKTTTNDDDDDKKSNTSAVQ